MITINNLTKKFGTITVLDDISIHFGKGKVYGIVGENGSGKTTLFRCIAELEKFEGTIVSELIPFRQRLGYIMAEQFFISKITGKEYIRLLLEARGKKGIDIKSKNIFDLPLDRYIESYSTGMKKKLAITASILQNNEFIIMDEPFNGLDLSSCIILTELIKILKNKGKTIILSSHIFASLTECCDEIIKLENGKLSNTIHREDFKLLEEELKSKILPQNIADFI